MSFKDKISRVVKERHFNELLKESGSAFILRILGLAVTYIFTISVTRISGADVWGVFSIFFTVSFLTSIITKMGIDLALVKFVSEYNTEKNNNLIDHILKKSSLLVLPILILLTAAYYILAPSIAEHVFGKEFLTSTIRYSAFTLIPLTYSSFFIQTLRGIKKIRLFSFFQFVGQYGFAVLFYGGIIYITGDNESADVPVFAFILSVYLLLIITYLYVRKYVKVDESYATDKKISYREILSSSIPLLLATSAVQLMVMVDTFFLGIYDSVVSTEEIGVYNVASRVARVSMIIPTAINAIAAPKMSELFKENIQGEFKSFVRRTSGLIFVVSLPVTILVLLIPEIILGLFGEEFKEGVYILFILIVARQITSFSGSVSFVLQMIGKEKVLQNIVLVALIINIVLNIYLIPKTGAIGASVATGVSLTVYILGSIIYLKTKQGIEAYYLPRLRRK